MLRYYFETWKMIRSFSATGVLKHYIYAAAGWNSSLERMSALRTDHLKRFTALKTL